MKALPNLGISMEDIGQFLAVSISTTVLLGPLFAFEILLVLKVEHNIDMSYTAVFAPFITWSSALFILVLLCFTCPV